MDDQLFYVFCAYGIALAVSLLLFEWLLKVESHVPEGQRHRGGRAVGFLGMARAVSGRRLQWGDIKALLLGLRLYVTWLVQVPLWVPGDPRARRGLWAMRLLFWLCILIVFCVLIVNMHIVKEGPR